MTLLPRLKTIFFVASCGAIYAASAFLTPRAFPLLQPDSASYIEFSNTRSAIYPIFLRALSSLGLGLEQITYIQLALFVLALMVLISALLRTGVPRALVIVFVIGLAASFQFPSFHWTIMTESIFFTVAAIGTAYWLDYLRAGRIIFLAVTCLCVGLMVAIRPAGLAFVPMIAISLRLKWHQRNTSWPAIAAVVIISLSLWPALEQLMYRAVHESQRASIFPATMIGKAAMLVQQNTVFTGTHAAQLKALGAVLYATYQPVHQFLSSFPSLPALPIETAAYEVAAQRQILNDEILAMSSKTGVPGDTFRIELGLQAMRDNVPGYIRLSLMYYFGQWSIMALRFPPTSEAVNAFVASYPKVPLPDKVGDLYLHPPASRIAILVYPLLLIAGGISLIVSLLLTIFIVRPSLGDTGQKRDLLLASFFAATAQIYTLLISFINVPTPRYLIAVYPQIMLVGIFLFLAVFRRTDADDHLNTLP